MGEGVLETLSFMGVEVFLFSRKGLRGMVGKEYRE